MALTLAAHQPAYLPWLGYFEKIARADVFVYLDTVQFEKNSYTNRNHIKTPQGPQWLTVPVLAGGHTSSTLAELAIDERQPWRAKHLKAIAQHYRKAAWFEPRFPLLERLYATPHERLAELCVEQLGFWLAQLGLERRVVRASSLPPMGRKSDLVLDLCRHFGADRYLAGALGRDYLDEAAFRQAGVEVLYQDYQPKPYVQLYGAFVPALGVVDAWLNVAEVPV